jgi:hypothetical protein
MKAKRSPMTKPAVRTLAAITILTPISYKAEVPGSEYLGIKNFATTITAINHIIISVLNSFIVKFNMYLICI